VGLRNCLFHYLTGNHLPATAPIVAAEGKRIFSAAFEVGRQWHRWEKIKLCLREFLMSGHADTRQTQPRELWAIASQEAKAKHGDIYNAAMCQKV